MRSRLFFRGGPRDIRGGVSGKYQKASPAVTFLSRGYPGPILSHDHFSDGDLSGRPVPENDPVEVVPTPDKIPCLIRYFRKIPIFIRKKPCNLAGFG